MKIHLGFTFGISTDVCSGFAFLVVARLKMWLKLGSMHKCIDILSLGSKSMDRTKKYQEIFNSKTQMQEDGQQLWNDTDNSHTGTEDLLQEDLHYLSLLQCHGSANLLHQRELTSLTLTQLWMLMPESWSGGRYQKSMSGGGSTWSIWPANGHKRQEEMIA